MNAYGALAIMVDIIHCIVLVYWFGAFFVSASKHPKFREIHNIFVIVILIVQIIFSLRCPLVLLSGYLRELAHPGFTDHWLYKPFVVELLKSAFNFQAPDIAITVVSIIGAGLAIVTLIGIRKRKVK